jgi:dihydrofolate reductase
MLILPPSPRICIIAAVAANYAIGKNYGLPWKLPGDSRWFHDKTLDHVVIMGQRTFQSLPHKKPLRRRQNIVISREEALMEDPSLIWMNYPEEAFRIGKEMTQKMSKEELFIIGGGEIYKHFIDRADRMYLTWVHAEPEADAFFPQFDESLWKRQVIRDYPRIDTQPSYTIMQYDRP